MTMLPDLYLREEKSQLADLFLTPQASRYGLLEFSAYEPVIEIGYRAAQEALAQGKVAERLNGF